MMTHMKSIELMARIRTEGGQGVGPVLGARPVAPGSAPSLPAHLSVPRGQRAPLIGAMFASVPGTQDRRLLTRQCLR